MTKKRKVTKNSGTKKAAAKKAAADPKPAATDAPKFGVNDLAEALDLQPASVRIKLRKAGVEKLGKSYGWNTKKDFDAVVKQMKKDD